MNLASANQIPSNSSGLAHDFEISKVPVQVSAIPKSVWEIYFICKFWRQCNEFYFPASSARVTDSNLTPG